MWGTPSYEASTSFSQLQKQTYVHTGKFQDSDSEMTHVIPEEFRRHVIAFFFLPQTKCYCPRYCPRPSHQAFAKALARACVEVSERLQCSGQVQKASFGDSRVYAGKTGYVAVADKHATCTSVLSAAVPSRRLTPIRLSPDHSHTLSSIRLCSSSSAHVRLALASTQVCNERLDKCHHGW